MISGHVLPAGSLTLFGNQAPAPVSFTCQLCATGGFAFATKGIVEPDPIVGLMANDLTMQSPPQSDAQVA